MRWVLVTDLQAAACGEWPGDEIMKEAQEGAGLNEALLPGDLAIFSRGTPDKLVRAQGPPNMGNSLPVVSSIAAGASQRPITSVSG